MAKLELNRKPGAFVPSITPVEFNILLSLLSQQRHGLGIIQEIAERTKNELFLSAGTLYTALKRMHNVGLIEATIPDGVPENGNNERRKYYRLTAVGYEMIVEEIDRMERVAQATRVALTEAESSVTIDEYIRHNNPPIGKLLERLNPL